MMPAAQTRPGGSAGTAGTARAWRCCRVSVVRQPRPYLVLDTLLRTYRADDECSRSAKPASKELLNDGLVHALVPSRRILDADIAVVVPSLQ